MAQSDDDVLLTEEGLLKALVVTPAWERVRTRLLYRMQVAAERVLTRKGITEAEVAAEQREYQLLRSLVENPVEFFLELRHQEELEGRQRRGERSTR